MKRLVFLSIVLLVGVFIFAGCGAPAPPPAPAPAPAPPPAPAPAPAPVSKPVPVPTPTPSPATVIRLNFAEQDPLAGWGPVYCWQPLIKKMEEVAQNRIKINYYPGQTLCKGIDAWKATKSGVADIAWCFHGYWAGMTPLADVVSLPFLPFKSAEQASGILWQLYEKYPSIKKSFAENHIQLVWTSDPYFIITTKKQVKTMEDLKGMKIRTVGGPPTDAVKALGAVPMMIPMPDCYLALQKGVIDGMGAPWEAIEDNRLMEAVQYYTYVPLFHTYFSIAWNWDRWNSLPPDIQKAIMDKCGGITGSKYAGYNMFDTAAKEGPELVKKQGYTMVENTPPPAEVQRWQDVAGKPLWEPWVKRMEAAGYPEAREILNTVLDLIKTNP